MSKVSLWDIGLILVGGERRHGASDVPRSPPNPPPGATAARRRPPELLGRYAAAAAAAARWAARGGGVPSLAFTTTRRAPSERALPTVAWRSSFSALLWPGAVASSSRHASRPPSPSW